MKTWLAYIILVAVAGAGIWLFLRRSDNSSNLYDLSPSVSESAGPSMLVSPTQYPVRKIEGGLQIQDAIIGEGVEVNEGDVAVVHYVGALTNGAKFDSSYDRDKTFQFKVGAGEVIKGWDLGVLGMKVGGKRKLLIPPALAYGENGIGAVIPPNSILFFEIDLISVIPGK